MYLRDIGAGAGAHRNSKRAGQHVAVLLFVVLTDDLYPALNSLVYHACYHNSAAGVVGVVVVVNKRQRVQLVLAGGNDVIIGYVIFLREVELYVGGLVKRGAVGILA